MLKRRSASASRRRLCHDFQNVKASTAGSTLALARDAFSRARVVALDHDLDDDLDIPYKPLQDLRRMDHLACSPQLLRSHSFLNRRIGFALGATMKSTGNIAVSAAAETGRSTRGRDTLTGRKRSFAAGEYPSATEGRHRQDLRLNRTPEYGFPICTSTEGSRPAFETTVLQPAARPMIPNRHVNLGTRIRQSRRAGRCYRASARDFSFLVFPTERLPPAPLRPPSFAWLRPIGSTIRRESRSMILSIMP